MEYVNRATGITVTKLTNVIFGLERETTSC